MKVNLLKILVIQVMELYQHMSGNEILIDGAGWGDLILGVVNHSKRDLRKRSEERTKLKAQN